MGVKGGVGTRAGLHMVNGAELAKEELDGCVGKQQAVAARQQHIADLLRPPHVVQLRPARGVTQQTAR